MSRAVSVAGGGYAFLPSAPHPFSGGVVAARGHALTRIRLRAPLPLAEGFAFAASFLGIQGRPPAALAACELRSPAPMSMADFAAFNAHYVTLLRHHGFAVDAPFPIARSNMAPRFDPPATNVMFAFTYAHPADDAGGRDFVISGKPENIEAPPGGIFAPGDVSPAGLAAKAQFVLAALQERVAALGGAWADVTGAQAYTVHSLDPMMSVLHAHGLARAGLTLFPAYPPIVGLDFEIDVRAVSVERAV